MRKNRLFLEWLAGLYDRHKLIGNPSPQMPRLLHHRPAEQNRNELWGGIPDRSQGYASYTPGTEASVALIVSVSAELRN